ncbi:formate/nitrite transporter family protein [Staphylococcus simiae]|uniref:formate/nitrite transporter family protein n=1 Tax=Staphylococcus simiae TaxID=308354 RepID=UPI001A96B601|nr:formate/nitrite transporter family protein [Staphylococcus simiae]MBO1199652.1 formate/nitrite transporter family protein [Staphylococcus simiae]MBO1202025.1 formate/nitrite transporter family protein [Staphylococcus simiae]MBO1204240.1 formate/nitrite transporter family protein [Staphylococcus simiae]MBO1211694.1 formate/nitrite transporter family protein [Staphylococcus simiae]MBO1230444.1 formate/nitrite transporter family protein [Staphylococcus simiae]
MLKNNKTVEDTYSTRPTVEAIASSVQMKQVMADKTPGRYLLKAMMAGFLLSIVTVFMLAIKTQFAATHLDGLVNLMGAIAFSLGLILVVLTNSELLTSNFMFFTVGWYYKVVTMKKMLWIFTFCFLGNIIGGLFLFFLMKFSHVMTPEMTQSLTALVHKKTVESTWLNIFTKGIFCNFFINVGIFIAMQFKDGLSKAFYIGCGVVVFVFMGYEHVVFNAGLYAGMLFFNLDALNWMGVLKNLVFAFLGNYVGGGLFIGLVFAYLNGKRNSLEQH